MSKRGCRSNPGRRVSRFCGVEISRRMSELGGGAEGIAGGRCGRDNPEPSEIALSQNAIVLSLPDSQQPSRNRSGREHCDEP